jgi:hypothetical protein
VSASSSLVNSFGLSRACVWLAAEEAVQHLATWLSTHPQLGAVAAEFGPPPDGSQLLSHVVRLLLLEMSRLLAFLLLMNIVVVVVVVVTSRDGDDGDALLSAE